MGKRRKAAIRAKKRADVAAAELFDQKIDNQESARYEAKDNNELFVLDNVADTSQTGLAAGGNKNKRKKTSSLNLKQSKKNRVSEKDERQVRKLLDTHSADGVISLAAGQEERLKQRKRTKRIAGTAKANFDLWGEDKDVDGKDKDKNETKLIPVKTGVAAAGGTAPIVFKSVTKASLRKDIQQPAALSNKQLKLRKLVKGNARKSIQIELAQPGQSYRPDGEQHQDVIGEALNIELRRKEALEYSKAPIGGGQMSQATLALLINSDDEESSDDEEDEDTNMSPVKPAKRKEKLTKAQRNKQKRVKALKVSLDQRKLAKKLLHSLHDSKKISKDIRKHEAERIARRVEITALKEEERSKPLGINVIDKLSQLDPIRVPALPVALTEELKDGSLRTIKPKGSLLTDRMESMISRKMANRKTIEKKRVVQGKRRRMKSGKGREFLLA